MIKSNGYMFLGMGSGKLVSQMYKQLLKLLIGYLSKTFRARKTRLILTKIMSIAVKIYVLEAAMLAGLVPRT